MSIKDIQGTRTAGFWASHTAYRLVRLGGRMTPYLPMGLGYSLFGFLGRVAYVANRAGRRAVQNNLRHVLGPDEPSRELDRRARATFTHLGFNYFDLLRMPGMSAQNVADAVEFRGWENVDNALDLGKGVLMTFAHGSGMEVVLRAMSSRGLSITVPVERIEPPEMFTYVTERRTSRHLRLIPADGPMIGLVHALRCGGVAAIAGDRNIGGRGVRTAFFDAPTRLPDGHVRLARRTGAPLIVASSRRTGLGTYEATFHPHVIIHNAGSRQEELAAGLRAVVSGMEAAIRDCPEQWTITTDVWQSQPAD